MRRLCISFFCCLVLILPALNKSWAQAWEKQGEYYYLTKHTREYFSLPGAGPNKFSAKYLRYNGIDFLAGAPSDWEDYGRLNLEKNKLFALPIQPGLKVESVYLLAGGNYSNSYEHDPLLRLYGDKYFYATLSAIFVYADGSYREEAVPVFWDWFKLGPGEWSSQGARIRSLGENPVRPNCWMFWIGERPFSDVFALTLKSGDAMEALPRKVD